MQQLRNNIAALTVQCAQLDEANRAWQLYQQSQLDNFRARLQDYLPLNESATLDDIALQIADQMTKEREEFTESYAELEKLNELLHIIETIDNYCIAYEIVDINKYKIYHQRKKIIQVINQDKLKPFQFICNKN